MNGQGGGGGASSEAISGSGSINFGSDVPTWLIAAGIAAGLAVLGLFAWILTRK